MLLVQKMDVTAPKTCFGSFRFFRCKGHMKKLLFDTVGWFRISGPTLEYVWFISHFIIGVKKGCMFVASPVYNISINCILEKHKKAEVF